MSDSAPTPPPTPAATGTPAASPRRPRRTLPWLAAYGLLYAVVFAFYGYQQMTRAEAIAPAAWLDAAFPGWRDGAADQAPSTASMAALAEKNRPADAAWDTPTPGERRLLKPLVFTPVEAGAERVVMAEGARLSSGQAAQLAAALAHDLRRLAEGVPATAADWLTPRPLPNHAGAADAPAPSLPCLPFVRDTALTRVAWPYWLNLLNLAGFYLLIFLLLGEFIARFLDGERAKATDGLERARAAEAEAAELRRRNDALAAELDERRLAMTALADTEGAVERERLLAQAERDAATRRAGLESAVAAEIDAARRRLTAEVGREVVRRARELLAEHTTEEDHAAAVETFLRGLEAKEAWSSAIWRAENLLDQDGDQPHDRS